MLSVRTLKGTLSFGYSRDNINLRNCGLTEVPIELKGEHFNTLDLGNWVHAGTPNEIKKLPVWLCANEKLRTIILPKCNDRLPLLRTIPFHLHPHCVLYQQWSGATRWPVSKLYDAMTNITCISFIEDRATEICVALQELGLPAYVTYIIIEKYFPPNAIRMWAKWELITAVKHFHDRRSNASKQHHVTRCVDSDGPVSQHTAD
jgi:hypothetical protein